MVEDLEKLANTLKDLRDNLEKAAADDEAWLLPVMCPIDQVVLFWQVAGHLQQIAKVSASYKEALKSVKKFATGPR